MADTHRLEQNGTTLVLDEDGTLSFSLAGTDGWHAGLLGIMHFFDRQHPRAERVAIPSTQCQEMDGMMAGTLSLGATSSITIDIVNARALMVQVEFPAISIKLAMRIELLEDATGFDVSLVDLEENHADLYRILGLELLPEFGFAKTGESGYLTLPNWSGCQTFFDKDYPREVWQTVYSSNDQWEHNCNMPVFGITRAQGTLCGLIAEGDEDAQLVSRIHWEKRRANSSHPYLVWRWHQHEERNHGGKRVRYTFAPADTPRGEGYAFVGTEVRNYLRTERGVETWSQKAATRPEAVDFADRFFLKIFMGYKEPNAQGDGDYHCTCTCDEARQIVQQCLDRGMKKLAVILVGWGQDGHDGQSPRFFPVDERVGGEGKLRELVAWGKEKDVMMGVHTSFFGTFSCSPEFSMDDVVQHPTGEHWQGVIWSGGQSYTPCPTAMHRFVERDMEKLRELGFHGHHHFDAIGGFMPCYSERHPLKTRPAYIEAVRKNVRLGVEALGSVSTEMPFGQYFSVMDGFYHSFSKTYSFHQGCLVGRYFLDRVIPLVEIALHGSHQCGETVGDKARMLHNLSFSLSPHFQVCRRPSPEFGVPTYECTSEMLAEAYAFTYGPEGYMTRIGKLDIEAFWDLAPDVTRTRYSDGTEITVNQSEKAYDGLAPGDVRWRKP